MNAASSARVEPPRFISRAVKIMPPSHAPSISAISSRNESVDVEEAGRQTYCISYSLCWRADQTQAIVLARAQRLLHNSHMDAQPSFPSPAPWTFADRMYGLGNCLVDRDGRVIGANFSVGNGALTAQAPAIAALSREWVAGTSSDG